MERRRVAIVALLVFFSALSQLLYWLTRPGDEPPAFVGPPRSNYTLNEFELNALDEAGKLSFTVTAPSLARRNDDGSLWVQTPHFVLAGKDGNNWNGNSESAWVTKDGTRMLLAGAVDMLRPESASARAASIVTRDVTAWPKDKKMQTEAPATITQPGSILRGTGMTADLNTHQMELLADVHASFASKHKP
ncbi:MAG: LPS export ABC transporter periplasmic protein LptC [Tahibacter sp.]